MSAAPLSPRPDHTVHRGGVFVVIEGPRFSTKAESQVFKQLGFAIIGMTAIPEAFLAREAGISYAAMAHVTDYDVWHETEAPVTVETVIRQLLANAEVAKQSLVNAIRFAEKCAPLPPCRCAARCDHHQSCVYPSRCGCPTPSPPRQVSDLGSPPPAQAGT